MDDFLGEMRSMQVFKVPPDGRRKQPTARMTRPADWPMK